MAVPPDQYALVGPLWSQFEDALHSSGAVGSTADEQINSLRSRLSSQRINDMHYVRMERNALQHRNPSPLSDPAKWERLARESIAQLNPDCHAPAPVSEESGSGLLGKIAAWSFGGYVVLHSPQLMELAMMGGLCWLGYKLVKG